MTKYDPLSTDFVALSPKFLWNEIRDKYYPFSASQSSAARKIAAVNYLAVKIAGITR